MNEAFRDCWFLTGPTASGKSAIGLLLAERAGAEIIGLDSMTIYRGMDIGTAKPSPRELARVPHHLIDVLEPDAPASIDWFLREAEKACAAIRERGNRPLFVGGTPLYLKACLRGLFEGPPADPNRREELEREAERVGVPKLHERLAKVDPVAARKIQPGDLRRIVRAIEVFEATGKPISIWQRQFDKPADPAPPVACLRWPRPRMRERINRRVDQMLEAGWVDEVARLRAESGLGKQASQAAGYQLLGEHLGGRLSLEEVVPMIKARTRQLAKRQETWFRHLEEIRFFDLDDDSSVEQVADRIHDYFESFDALNSFGSTT
ncbi:IPP transferase [Planctomycetes bacterium Pan216]|uniref:tRNA dimethylallyltransferase n=1 Tax=Kolteria novifilia TaxID=2527975 RepID=A0A518BCV8_9BACT|nr:IPP transferase [Planctomycetes bacterium Pan216]